MNATTTNTAAQNGLETRILRESYGDGAWHGPDLKAALADVSSDATFQRPAPGRRNIAEIALHHAYTARGVRAKLTGADPEPFVLDGDDWFDLPSASTLAWSNVLDVVGREQERLAACVSDLGTGRARSALTDAERLDLVLGITCHAVYHAGQIQLIKKILGN